MLARLASDVSVPWARGAVAAALALLLLAALASAARASHAAPTGVTVTPGASQVTVDWTASSGADGYRVQWKSGTQNWDPDNRQMTVSGGTTETATISSLTPATVYTVRVGATKGTEDPVWSDTATGAPLFGCEGSTAVGGEQPVAGPNNDLIDDCENLLAAQDTLRGTASLGWATTLAMSSWLPGQVFITSGRVTHLQLGQKSLTGTIPGGLGNLSSLTHLSLNKNQLTGEIPAGVDGNDNPTGLAKLTNLTNLDLSQNQLTGGVPAALSKLTNLVNLRLWGNKLTGEIPAGVDSQDNPTGLAKLSKLKWLHLSKNQLSGGIPAALGRLDKVTSLLLQENQLSGGIPAALGGMASLQHLYLNNNRLSGGIPAGEDTQGNPTGLARLSNLTQLRLYTNQLTGGIPAGVDSQDNPTGLARLSELTQLMLSGNQFSGTIPTALGKLTKVQYLYLHRNQLTGPIPAGTDTQNQPTGLAKMTKLRWLYMNCNNLSGSVPAEFAAITTLKRLGINGNTGLDPTLPAALKARTDVTYPQLTCPGPPASDPPRDSKPAPAPPPRPRLAAALSGGPDPVSVGGRVTYTLTVTNTGTVPLTGLVWRSPELGVARRAIGDGALAVGAAAEATFSFGPVTQAHLPGPIVVTVLVDSDQTGAARAALAVAVQTAAQPAGQTTDTTTTTTTTGTETADPRPAASALPLAVERAAFSTPDPSSPHLGHNILDVALTPAGGVAGTLDDGATVACDFLTHYEASGGLARWGYATSEILEERPGALTQYYQRGAVDCHFREGRWRMERRLTWDYLGGGIFGAPDLEYEPGLLSDQPGIFPGPWGHRVSNYAVDGTFTGFLDFFQAHGGVLAFGYPKTEARRDDHPAAVLRLPGADPGVIRQYFQAAVFEYHPDDPAAPVKLVLADDLLRDLLYPNDGWQPFWSFHPVPILTSGEGYIAERVLWNPRPA